MCEDDRAREQEAEGRVIHHGDNLEVMAAMPDYRLR
jgi:hypothetical protein